MKCINIFFSTIEYDESNDILSSEIIPFSFTEKNSYMNSYKTHIWSLY